MEQFKIFLGTENIFYLSFSDLTIKSYFLLQSGGYVSSLESLVRLADNFNIKNKKLKTFKVFKKHTTQRAFLLANLRK